MSNENQEELKTGVVRVINQGTLKDCDHSKDGFAEKSEEHSMQRPMNEYRIVSHFKCHRCGFSAMKYLTDWQIEGSKW